MDLEILKLFTIRKIGDDTDESRDLPFPPCVCSLQSAENRAIFKPSENLICPVKIANFQSNVKLESRGERCHPRGVGQARIPQCTSPSIHRDEADEWVRASNLEVAAELRRFESSSSCANKIKHCSTGEPSLP